MRRNIISDLQSMRDEERERGEPKIHNWRPCLVYLEERNTSTS